MISLKDKNNSEQIFWEVTIQLDLSEKLFWYAVHHYDKVCTWSIMYIDCTVSRILQCMYKFYFNDIFRLSLV